MGEVRNFDVVGGQDMMLEIIEELIKWYFLKSECILTIFLLINMIVIVLGLIVMRREMRYTIYRIVNKVFYCATIAILAILLNNIGISIEISYTYFSVMFFAFSLFAIVLYEIVQCLIFKTIIEPASQGIKNIQYIIFFTIFLLGLTSKLSPLEWSVATSLFIGLQLILFEIEKKKKEKKIEHSVEVDYPSSELYYTRRMQLDSFIPVLKQQRDEPYAIMVSGEWGIGKSSFLQAVEEKLPKDDFVWIHAGSELTVSDIMIRISEEILEVLRRNSIFIEKDSVIEKYFLAFAGVVSESKLKIYNGLSKIMKVDKEYCSKDYLNSKLSKLGTTIYLVIDDLDRCDEEYQDKMFKVIRESTDLVNCKTIFVVDKNKFLRKSNHNDIEKYVTYTLDLCKVEYDEIASFLINDFFDETFLSEINPIIGKGRDKNELKKEIYEFPLRMIGILEERLKAKDKPWNSNNSDIDKEKHKEENKDIDILQTVRKNIVISRKVKKYFKNIKSNLSNINLEINECSKEYKAEDWFGAILNIQFIKNFLPDCYAEIKQYRTLQEYRIDFKHNSVFSILGLLDSWLDYYGMKGEVLNLVLYKFDIINYKELKTRNNKYHEEMNDKEKATIKHINEYLECYQNKKDLEKIIELFSKNETIDYEKRFAFISGIMAVMSEQSSRLKTDNEEFLEFSNKLADFFKSINLIQTERNFIINKGRTVVRRVIVDNTYLLRNVLEIVFKATDVSEKWPILAIADVDEFYKMLYRLDKDSCFGQFKNEEEHLPQLKTYYKNLQKELSKEKYSDIGLDINTIFKQIYMVFSICEFWSCIDKKIGNEDRVNRSLFDKYFILKDVNDSKDIAFSDEKELVCALKELKKFYALKKQNYDSKYSLILLRVLNKSVMVYEEKPEWYETEMSEISSLFSDLLEMVLTMDNGDDKESKIVIEKIRIYTYKFKQYSVRNNAS